MIELKAGIEILPTYDGTNKKHLNTFVKQVDKLMIFINALNPPLTDFERFTVTNGILSRIKGKAFESLDNTDTSKWDKIKETLKNQHLIYKNYATIFNEIIYLNEKDPYKLFTQVNEKAKEFNDIIRNEFPVDDNIEVVFEKIIIQNFINKVSEPFGSNLANRQPQSLSELGNLLQNDYQFLKQRQNRIPHSNNKIIPIKQLNNIPIKPSYQPINPQPSTSKQKNFAPRQNIINAQQARKFNPTPMSIQSKLSRNNYFHQQNKPNFVFEEINAQDNEYQTDFTNYEEADIQNTINPYEENTDENENVDLSFLDIADQNIEEK